ncbi:MAG TPA: ABC transporter permease, partial [Puia sp.]|nr:ABC transporter permease [Puia sp.]
MFKNYFKTAFRNLKRNKSYAFINTLGLTVGIASCLLLFMVIRFETSFDNFHPKKNSIYRVCTEFHNQDGVTYSAGVSFPVGPSIRIDFPQIKEVASMLNRGGQVTVNNGNSQANKFSEDNVYFAEPELFAMFHFEWLNGDAKTSLKNPGNAVLTQATADKYFGNWKDALGKTITLNNKDSYIVTGILKDVPVNSDFPLKIVIPYSALANTNVKG